MKKILLLLSILFFLAAGNSSQLISYAKESDELNEYKIYGGGFAATGQIEGSSFSTKVYDSSNGLPTSDAMFILGASDGHIYVGGYSGVFKYDGSSFDRIEGIEGLTSARAIFEDSKGRIWVGTNDNGVVVVDGNESRHFTYKDGLTSSSIRIFAEDNSGNIFVGTTSGVCYIDPAYEVHFLTRYKIADERVLKMDKSPSGTIYGQATNGLIFAIDDCKISQMYDHKVLGFEKITSILADPHKEDMVYIGTEGSYVYYGKFGDKKENMKRIDVSPISETHWLSYDCGRVWVSSINMLGYIDEDSNFHLIENLPLTSGIEMTTSDYQGNMWVASSTQGVMKLVTNNFINITEKAGLPSEVTNAAYKFNENLYIGTNSGLKIVDKNGESFENELTEYIGDARVRDIISDEKGNLWVATFNHDLGLVCYSAEKEIKSFDKSTGMPDNQIRTIIVSKDGGIIAATNGGIAIIENDKVIKKFTSKDGIKNPVFLTLVEGNEGIIFAGSDGDGIYAIDGDNINKIDREEGLTSDVVMRIVKDEKRQLIWIVTSNSIQYMKDKTIYEVTTFPYNNNYDIYFDDEDNAWILSSYGIYKVKADDMMQDNVTDYRLYTLANGLPFAITGNSFGYIDNEGNLYIPGRYGLIGVNINNYFEKNEHVLMGIKSVYCNKEYVLPDKDGVYNIPSTSRRVQITPSVMDYTMVNPTIRLYLEGGKDDGVTYNRDELVPMEFTNLPYGNYKVHIQLLNSSTGEVIQDNAYRIKKSARIDELIFVRVLTVFVFAIITGLIVWWTLRTTVISRQYAEITRAKEEAEKANEAKSRFLANISHEIRTPINTILGMNEMILREDSANVPKGYYMSMMNYAFDIRNAADSLLGLINDLLDISKIESGKMHLVEQEYDTADMLRSIISMIKIKSNEKGLSFDVVVDEIFPKRLYGDAGKIKQVVLNILTNAVKYTSKGGFCLNVSMYERNGAKAQIRISVKDTGMGVKEEDMEKLFTAYERLDEEKNSSIQGTGLGLNISRKFAELMGGNLWCESVYGEGSEFIFTFEQIIADESPVGAFVLEESKASGHYVPKFVAPDADILVVDDNPMNLNVLKGLLKATKVFVTTADSGEEAIDKLKDNDYDVVFLDHMMPGLDGIETLAIIREFKPDIPVYALTANSVAGEDFYLSKGFNGFLGKPVDGEALEKTIMKHLPESKMEKPSEEDVPAELTEIPEDMSWIYDVEGINVEEGIKNSGGVSGFLYALDLFLETIDENTKLIKDAYESDNIRLYTIKVHALKSSCRIIGALDLSNFAKSLEDAGNQKDITFISAKTDDFLKQYNEYKDKLSRIIAKQDDNTEKEMITEENLKDAYEALAELIPQMDYDSVEMIVNNLTKYLLPEEDANKISELNRLLKKFDWEGMEDLILK